MRLTVEQLEGRYAPDAAPADAQPDPDAGLEYLKELRAAQQVALVAAAGGPLAAVPPAPTPPPGDVPFLPSDLILPTPVPVKP